MDPSLYLEMPIYFRGEDPSQGVIIKRINAKDVEMPQKSVGNLISSTPWRAEGTYEVYIKQFQF